MASHYPGGFGAAGTGASGAGAGAGPNAMNNVVSSLARGFGGLALRQQPLSGNVGMGVLREAASAVAAGPATAGHAYKVGTGVLVTMGTESEPPSEEIIKLYNPVFVEDRYLVRNNYIPVEFGKGKIDALSYLRHMRKKVYTWSYDPRKGYPTFGDGDKYYLNMRVLSRNAKFCMKGINPAYADASLQTADLIIFSAYPLIDESSGERHISILSYATIKYHVGSPYLEVDVLCSKQNEWSVSNTAAFLLMRAQELAIAIGGKTHLYLSAVPDKVSYYESLKFEKDPSHVNTMGASLVPMRRGLDYEAPVKGGKRKNKRKQTRKHKKSKSQKKRR